jgi:hypothetical protein
MVGAFKRGFRADTKVLVAMNDSVDFTKENFFEFLQNVVFNYNDKVLSTDFRLSGSIIENFPIFIDLLVENKLAGICDTDENFKLEEGMNLLLLTIADTFKNKVKTNSFDQNEVAALRAQLNQIQNNNVSQQVTVEKKLPDDFKEAYRLFQIQFEKLLTNENQISLFKTHQLNRTVPPSLLWSRFPQPMLPFDKDFVDEQNELISDFQVKNINLCIKYCNKRVTLVNETLAKYKSHYPNEEGIDDKLDKIKGDTERLLKKKFDEDHRVISNYTPCCRKVSQKIQPNDSSFENRNPYKSNQRDKRDRSMNNNSSVRYYNQSKRSRGNNHNNNNSRNNNHNNNNSRNNTSSNIRSRRNYTSTPNRDNRNSNGSQSRSHSRS